MKAHLDRRVRLATVESSTTTVSTWKLPYACPVNGSEGTLIVVRQDNGAIIPSHRNADPLRVHAAGNWKNVPVWIGVPYTFRYVPTGIAFRGDGGVPEDKGRLQVRYIDIVCPDTRSLTVGVSPVGRPEREAGPPHDGRLRVGVHSQNTQFILDIYDSSPYPVALVALDWEGHFTQRSRRF